MIEITNRITSVTTSADAIAPLWPAGAERLQAASVARAPSGSRITLKFSRTVPLPPHQVVRLRYDFAGDGRLLDCVGTAQPTHTVARRGHLVVFHYRLSRWIAPAAFSPLSPGGLSTAMVPRPAGEEPTVDRSPV